MIYRNFIGNQAKLTSTIEFDYLLTGKQDTQLSDAGFGHSDVSNTQDRGYGFKVSFIHEKDGLSVGPYLHYWNIAKSNVVPEIINGSWTGQGLIEPQNNTIEIGLKASRHF